MQLTREDVSPCLVNLEIQVEPEQYADALNRAKKHISKHTEIPGFRKGKAPAAMLERVIDQDRVASLANDYVMPEAYSEALKEQDLTPWDNPDVEILEQSPESGLKFKVSIPLVPMVELGQYKGLNIDRPVQPVTEQLVNRELDRLRKHHTKLEPKAEDGVVEDGDYIFVSIQELDENGENVGDPGYNAAVVGENVPDFDTQVKGMKAEEERELSLSYPEDWQEADKAGKTVRARVKVAQVYAQVVPELDEAFAKLAGDFESVDALREEIRHSAENALIEIADEQAEANMMRQVVQNAKIEYPPQMLTQEFQHRVGRQFQELKKKNLSFEQFLAENGMDEEQYKNNLSLRIDWDIRVSLSLSAISTEEKIDVTPEEIDAEVDTLSDSETTTAHELMEYLSTEKGREDFARRRRTNKVLEFLRESSNTRDVTVDPAAQEAAANAAASQSSAG